MPVHSRAPEMRPTHLAGDASSVELGSLPTSDAAQHRELAVADQKQDRPRADSRL